MAVKTAEDFILNCHRCNKAFDKADIRIATPKKGVANVFWFLCMDCFKEEGGVWWSKCDVSYTVNRGDS